MSGNAIVASWGPEEHDPTSSRYQQRDQRILTAIGRELQRTRRSASWAILDKVEQDWDLLGRVVATRRYATPTSATASTVWTTHYDSLGQVLSMQEPGASAVDTTYDEDGNALETSWMDGSRRRVARTSYDGLGRVTKRDLASILSGVETLESRDIYHYDTHSGASEQPAHAATLLRGRLSWIENPSAGNVCFGYDPLGRGTTEVYKYAGLTGVTSQTSALSAGGVPITPTLKTPQTTDTLTYDYDSAWRNTTIKSGTSTLFNASAITTLGEYRTVVFGNGTSEFYTYAATGRREPLTTTIMTASGAYMFENRTRDAAGRVITEAHSTPTGSTTFTTSYDSLGRMQNRVQMSGIMPGIEGFTYDGLGNLATRTSTTGSGDRVYTTMASDPDRLCRFATPGNSLGTLCDFTYDGAGNVATDKANGQTRTFTYDAGQRITKITRGQQTVNLAYGPLGRLKTTVSGTNARTVWNLGGLIERRTRADGVVQLERMVPGPLGVFVSLRTTLNASGTPAATETIYRHGDGRANRFFTKASGHAVQQATYAAFGAKTSDTGTQGITYTDDLWNGGDDLPEVGVTLLGPRAYDPAVGRFLQRDPIAVMARSTTANPYAFSFNDPVNYADPSGLTPCFENPTGLCIGAGAVAAVGGFLIGGSRSGGGGNSSLPMGVAFGSSQMNVAGTSPASDDSGDWGEEHLAPRAQGVARMGLASVMVLEGFALCDTVAGCFVGAPLGAAGFDQGWTGLKELIWGEPQQSLFNRTIAHYLGDSNANDAEAVMGMGVAGWVGSGGRSRWIPAPAPRPPSQPAVVRWTEPEPGYNYRGVHAGHPAYADAARGVVTPGRIDGNVGAEEHNLGGVSNVSPYTSWTARYEVALDYAKSGGPGGIVLRVKQGLPPPGATWSWEMSDDWYGEGEMLLRGTRSDAEVQVLP